MEGRIIRQEVRALTSLEMNAIPVVERVSRWSTNAVGKKY
jgi:hypothetical protein